MILTPFSCSAPTPEKHTSCLCFNLCRSGTASNGSDPWDNTQGSLHFKSRKLPVQSASHVQQKQVLEMNSRTHFLGNVDKQRFIVVCR